MLPFSLRELTSADAPSYFNLIDGNREYFAQFDNVPRDKYPSIESVVDMLAQPQKKRWGMFVGEQLIGAVNLKPTDDPSVGEVGYLTAEAFTGKGYTTQALKEVLQRIPGSFRSLIAVTDPANEASQRVLEKTGFVFSHTNGKGDPVYRLER